MINLRKFFLLSLLFAFALTSCVMVKATAISTERPLPPNTRPETASPVSLTEESQQATTTLEPALEETKPIPQSSPTETGLIAKEESTMTTILISVGQVSYSAKLYDNETTRALLAQFPLSFKMSELNGKEKYYNLAENLPSTVTKKPTTINAGDIMLWSSNVLVLFYSTFPNSYGGYVNLGYVEDVTGLADVLGSGDVQVTFTVSR